MEPANNALMEVISRHTRRVKARASNQCPVAYLLLFPEKREVERSPHKLHVVSCRCCALCARTISLY